MPQFNKNFVHEFIQTCSSLLFVPCIGGVLYALIELSTMMGFQNQLYSYSLKKVNFVVYCISILPK